MIRRKRRERSFIASENNLGTRDFASLWGGDSRHLVLPRIPLGLLQPAGDEHRGELGGDHGKREKI